MSALSALSLISCSVSSAPPASSDAPAAAAPVVDTPLPTAAIPDGDLPPVQTSTDGVVRFDAIEQAALNDIQDKTIVSVADEKNTVYLSAVNFANLGDDVSVAKQAALLNLNMLSNGPKIETIRNVKGMPGLWAVNITDFLGSSTQANIFWKQIEDSAVLRIVSQTSRGKNLQFITGKQIPVMHLQVFLETAMLAKNYYAIKGIPTDQTAFYAQNGIVRQDLYDARDSGISLSAFAQSLIAPGHNRLVEKLDGDNGSCWTTFDINSLDLVNQAFADLANFFKNPFPKEAKSVNSTFNFSASETICAQKNGLYNVALWNAAGVRQDVAPTTVVLNLRASALGLDADIKPRDCTGCHTTMVLPFKDEVGDQIKTQPFSAADKNLGLLFFKPQTAVDASIQDDNKSHQSARDLLSIPLSGSDPVNVGAIDKMRRGFNSKEMAAFFYLSESEFLDALNGSKDASALAGQLSKGGLLPFFALEGGIQTIITDLNLFKDVQ
jgi:hypothetical protein